MTPAALIVIGASRGGLDAVRRVLRPLPPEFPVPVLVVQHRSEDAQDLLASLLARTARLPVSEVEDKTPLGAPGVRIAPPGYHVLVDGDHLALSTEAAVRHSRPSIDVALESAAAALGETLIGVVLTGDNDDGAAGLAAVRRRGGMAVVQDPEEAEGPTMPAAAVAAARPQVVARLDEIGPLLVRLAGPAASNGGDGGNGG